MIPHYGKREAGALTAASPGDTLFFAFGSYNDSGDSEVATGFAVSDIEVFKNGIAVTRATDSGYSLISDTGMLGDRVGLYRFSVQLFNTSDDTGHYESGAWYQVAVDSLSIDGKVLRFWVGSFEIGRQRVDLRAVLGDTGAANLDQGRLGVIADSGHIQGSIDTGKVSNAVWDTLRANHTIAASFGHDLLDSGMAALVLDTGKVAAAVWTSHLTRTLTAFALDTGVRDTIWRASPSAYTSDTGSFGYAAGRLMAVRNDTGAAHLDQGRLGVIADSGHIQGSIDTGKVSNAVWDSLRANHTIAASFGHDLLDSGMAALVLDTGKVSVAVWSSQNSTFTDTGSFGFGVNVHKLRGDTGAAKHLQQAFDLQNTNSDTGLIVNAAAIRVQTDKLMFDTGANELHADIRKVNNVQIKGAGDTGLADIWRPVTEV